MISDAAILERAIRLANQAIKTVILQYRRIRTSEPEDSTFFFRQWADLQFYILSLQWLRSAASIATNVSNQDIVAATDAAIGEFEQSIPGLRKLRNVGEHLDAYAVDMGRDPSVSRKELEVGQWDGTVFDWLGVKLNTVDAKAAAEKLFKTLQSMRQLLH
jgi:hypothetical protein